MNNKKFDNTRLIGKSLHPVVLNVRFYPDSDDDELTIYDSNIGPVYDEDIANLNKANPYVDFGDKGYFCEKGLYAFLPRGGTFRVVWNN